MYVCMYIYYKAKLNNLLTPSQKNSFLAVTVDFFFLLCS